MKKRKIYITIDKKYVSGNKTMPSMGTFLFLTYEKKKVKFAWAETV